MRFYEAIGWMMICFLLTNHSAAYPMEPNSSPVHQHISKEAGEVWSIIPYEIKNHTSNDINDNIDLPGFARYDAGDDIITGAAEEDRAISSVGHTNGNHFWSPDLPYSGHSFGEPDYNAGLIGPESAYVRSSRYWRTQVIPAYVRGDKDKAYYWLGRAAHLLQDSAQPSHVLLDPHFTVFGLSVDPSELEIWTGENENYYKYDGIDYSSQQYNYEDLIPGFNWTSVELPRDPYSQNKELFRLYWYTAQKSQYWASDDVHGNTTYVEPYGFTKNWSCTGTVNTNLWIREGYTLCAQFISNHYDFDETTVEQEADAVVPHAMKATAGLYRLFWDTVQSYEWTTIHHTTERTGATILKGDIKSQTDIKLISANLQSGVSGSEATSRLSIGNIMSEDIFANNKANRVVITTSNGSNGKVSVVHYNATTKGYTADWNWTHGTSFVDGMPTIANVNTSDTDKEIILGFRNGTIVILDGKTNKTDWTCTVPQKYSPIASDYYTGQLANFAVADIDNDGTQEIVFTDSQSTALYDWPATLYILSMTGTTALNGCTGSFKLEGAYTLPFPGSYDPPSFANLDNEDKLEIIVPTYYGLYVFDYGGSNATLSPLWSNNTLGLIDGSATVIDIDHSGTNELVIVTTNSSCSTFKTSICQNRLWVLNGSNGGLYWSTALSIRSRTAPSVADIDYNGHYDIIISGHNAASGTAGKVQAYNGTTGSQLWSYNRSNNLSVTFNSPSLADIDNDGYYNVIFATPSPEKDLLILRHNGSLFITKELPGGLGSDAAIGMITNKGTAEIALKHSGSPVTNVTLITGINNPPVIGDVSNITFSAGQFIDLNLSGQIVASDEDNDALTFYYSSPFNSSGQWQTNESDAGNFDIVIEVSDGNLTDWTIINVEVTSSLHELYGVAGHEIFEGFISNDGSMANNISWRFDTAVQNITSTYNASLNSNELLAIIFENNYTQGGRMNVSLHAHNDNYSINQSYAIVIYIDDLRISLSQLSSNSTQQIFEAIMANAGESNLSNIGWTFGTGAANITSTQQFDLTPSEIVYLLFANNYSSVGAYEVYATVNDSFNRDTETISITIT